MQTRINVILVVVLVAIGGYIGASWWVGGAVEQRLQQSEEQALRAFPNITLVSRDYRRGLFGATEDVTYGIGAGASAQMLQGRLLRALPGLTPQSLQLTLHHTIHYGPLPELRTVALATVDTQLQPPAGAQQAVRTVLHGAPALQSHTTIGFSGVSDIRMQSPAFQYRTAAGVTVTWQGLTGSARVTRALSAWSGTVSAPGLTLDAPQGHLQLRGVSFSADMQRAIDAVYVGHSDLRLQTFAVQPVGQKSVTLSGLSLQGDSSLTAGFIDQRVLAGVDRIDVAPFSFTRIVYSQSFNHLDSQSYAALLAALRDAQRRGPAPGSGAGEAARANLAILGRYGMELALHEPVLRIERFGFVTPDGELRLSAKVAMPGLTRDQMQGPLALLALEQHLDVSVDLRVDAALLQKLLDASGRGELIGPQLQQLEQQGYLRQDGSAWVTSVTFRSGALLINGQPYRRNAGLATH